MSHKPNKAQQEAIDYIDGPLLIIAGAGTGKTTVITQKIAQLVESGKAKPEEVLALTFTDKAAEEMQDRVDDMLDMPYSEMKISTFHGFCQQLLEEYGVEIGLPSQFKLMSGTESWLLMRENIYEFNLDYYRPLGNPTGNIHQLLSHFSKAKDELVSAQDYLDYVEGLVLDKDEAQVQEKNRLIELADAYHKYNQLLLDNSALDFGDLIFYTIQLLEERPNILQKVQERFKFVMVDEFQDVNWAQYVLIKLLTGKKTQLTVVGDDDQSIYAFRGSNVSIIMNFKKDFKKAKEIVLTENYRSGQEILDVAYNSIQFNNPDRLEKKLKIDKKLKAGKHNPKATVEHLHFATLDDEVVGTIKKIIAMKEKNQDLTWDDFAILVRANAHVEPFVDMLETFDVPYEYLASSGLYRQDVVIDSVSFFNILVNIYDDRAVYRLLRMKFLDFKENDLQKLTAMAKKKSVSYYEALKRAREFGISPQGIEVTEKLISLIHEGMKQSRLEKPTTVLYHFMEQSGYFTFLTSEEEKNNREVIRQIYHLKQFFDLIRRYEQATPGSSVASFIENYNYIIESGDGGKLFQPKDTPDSVNIITVHGAKGLEYKYVFVVNLVEERFPTRRKSSGIELPDELVKESSAIDSDFHYAEERRLFYVAVTRAKEGLFLTSASDYGGSRKKKISRFLTELGYDDKNARESEEQIMTMQKKQAEENLADMEYVAPKTFSYSKINSYSRCPYQYKLAHVLGLPMKGSASFSFGNTIHNTLQAFYERVRELNSATQGTLFGSDVSPSVETNNSNIQVPTLDELLKIYEDKWIADWYKTRQQREKYYAQGKEVLKNFYKTQDGKWTIPVSLEGWFKIKVGDYFINGRIDRIDQTEDGGLHIIDYKTGKGKETLTAEDKQQLLIYQIAAETLPEYKHIGKVEQLTFYYVNEDLQTSFIGKEKDKEALKEKLLTNIEKIREGKFEATPNKFVCSYCDFKDICEYRQL